MNKLTAWFNVTRNAMVFVACVSLLTLLLLLYVAPERWWLAVVMFTTGSVITLQEDIDRDAEPPHDNEN